jgi:hypothetical protein
MQNNTKPRNVNKHPSKRTNPSDKLKHINNKLLTRLENALGNPIPNPEPPINPQNNPNIKPTTPSDFELPIILPKLPQSSISAHSKPRKLKKRRKKQSFMTDVGLIKNKLNTQSPTPFVENINQQIDSIINNINEIETDDNIKNINYKDDKHTDLIELINDIDSYKNYVQEEFDEVKYLIKFADRTHNLVNRHKNVMTKIFQKAGLRPAGTNNEDVFGDNKKEEKVYKKPKKESKYWEGDDSDNNEDYEPQMRGGYYYRRVKKDENDLGEVFNKLKKINQVKENLCHIQDDCLGYHYNLKKTIQEKNKH